MAATDTDEELARLRVRPGNVHLAGGFGPLLVGVLLFVLMVALAPTVAPERVVEEPVGGTSTTELTTTTSAPTTTTAAPGAAPTTTVEPG